jgi:integrase
MSGRGSVYSYETGRGRRWAFVFDAPRRVDRSRQQVKRRSFATKAAAIAALDEMRRKYERVTDPSTARLGDYLDSWVNQRHAVGAIRPATASQYNSALKMIGSELASVPLMKLTAADLDRRYAELAQDGGRSGNGRSASTIRKLHAAIRKGLVDAVRKGLIPTNVADAADPPSSSAARPAERAVWTADNGFAFLRSEVLGGVERPLAWLAMAGGLRRAELAGLRWSDVHGDELHIVRTISGGPDGVLTGGTPKTARGRRIVTLPSEAVAALDAYRREQRELYLATGRRPVGDAVLVSDSTVEPLTPSHLTGKWRTIVTRALRAGVVPYAMSLHDGRHWCGTRLVEAGVDLRTVSDVLGHADPAFTLRVYAHSDDDRRRQAASALASLG